MDRGAWHAAVHRVAKSWTGLKRQHARAYKVGSPGLASNGFLASLIPPDLCFVRDPSGLPQWLSR